MEQFNTNLELHLFTGAYSPFLLRAGCGISWPVAVVVFGDSGKAGIQPLLKGLWIQIKGSQNYCLLKAFFSLRKHLLAMWKYLLQKFAKAWVFNWSPHIRNPKHLLLLVEFRCY